MVVEKVMTVSQEICHYFFVFIQILTSSGGAYWLEIAGSYGWALLNGIPRFFINPFVYLFFILLWMHYRRQILFERKLFSVRLNNPWEEWFDSLVAGLLPGLILSLVAFGFGVTIKPMTMIIVGIFAFILSCFHIQYLCTAYAGGIVGLLAMVAGHSPQLKDVPVLGWVWSQLSAVNIPSLLTLIALLHFAESYVVRKNAGKGATPLLLGGKRGLLVGAYQLQKFWLVPFFALQPSSGLTLSHVLPHWWPYFSGPAAAGAGITFALLPAFIGSSDLAVSCLPSVKAKQSSQRLFLYSLLLFLLSIGSFYYPPLVVGAALFALVGHEFLAQFYNWREKEQSPMFVQLTRGVRVLAVIPKSPADRLGIKPGEVVVKINGFDINRPDQIYPALQVNPAFCKMEVLNAAGDSKYLQCTVYQGDHHQLGLILAPDEQSEMYVDMKAVSIIKLIRQQVDRGA